MLEIRGLAIRSPSRDIVTELALHLPGQGITALIGPSGCGKSSVLKWLAGILPQGLDAQGAAMLDGEPISPPHPAIIYQPQNDALFPWLTIAENAALGLRVAGLSARTAHDRVAPLFAAFGLSGTEKQFPAELSGGMRQRAAFLRTMVQPGRFLLVDEPFSALDAVTRLRMQDWLVARLAEHPRGVLLVTHDLHEATSLADRILAMGMRPGRVIADIAVPIRRPARTETALAGLRDTLKQLLLQETPS